MRMLRWRDRFLLAASSLSLLLALASGIFWVRSYFIVDAYGWRISSGTRSIASNGGGLVAVTWTNPPGGPVVVTPALGYRSVPAPRGQSNIPPTHSFAGFRVTERSFSGILYRSVRVPFYAVFFGLLLPPLVHWYRWRRRPRDPTLCPTCGYDLRASPARCPECGTDRRLPGSGAGAARCGG